jgi:hypothetical protein
MGVGVGGGKGPGLALTSLRTQTLVDWNRGWARGWGLLGAIVLGLVALFTWPNGPIELLCVAGILLSALFELWTRHVFGRDPAERESDVEEMAPKDDSTGNFD